MLKEETLKKYLVYETEMNESDFFHKLRFEDDLRYYRIMQTSSKK